MKASRRASLFYLFLVTVIFALLATGCGGANSSQNSKTTPPASSSNFVYVTLNTTAGVGGFAVDSSGSLSAIPGSPFAVPPGPGSIVRSGQFVFVGTTFPLTGPPFPQSFPIVTYMPDQATGALRQVASMPTTGVGALTVDPAGNFLYATTLNGLSVFSIGTTGQLTELSGSPFSVSANDLGGPLWFQPNGKFLYATEQDVVTPTRFFMVASINPQTGLPTPTMGLTTPKIAVGPESDGFMVTHDGKFLLNLNSATNQLCSYALDPNTGLFGGESLAGAPALPTSCTITEDLPMQITMDPSGAFVLLTNQTFNLDGNISVFRFSNGSFSQVTGSPFSAGHVPGLITFSEDGKFVIVGDQGLNFPLQQDITNDLMVFPFDSVTGALGPPAGPRFQLNGVPMGILAR